MRPSDEGAVRPVLASNEVLFLQMRSVGSHSTSGREKEGIKERIGSLIGWEIGKKSGRKTNGNIMKSFFSSDRSGQQTKLKLTHNTAMITDHGNFFSKFLTIQ